MKRIVLTALIFSGLFFINRTSADVFDWAESAPGYWVPPSTPDVSYYGPPAAYYYAPPPPPPAPVYNGPRIYFHFGFHSR